MLFFAVLPVGSSIFLDHFSPELHICLPAGDHVFSVAEIRAKSKGVSNDLNGLMCTGRVTGLDYLLSWHLAGAENYSSFKFKYHAIMKLAHFWFHPVRLPSICPMIRGSPERSPKPGTRVGSQIPIWSKTFNAIA